MKIRHGFVSNSSSSSFVIGNVSDYIKPELPKGNPYEAWQWLKSLTGLPKTLGVVLTCNGEEVDFRFEPNAECYKNDKVVEYEGCCDYCYGPFREWTEGEFVEEFAHDKFELKREE
jgi:hypothetical protein